MPSRNLPPSAAALMESLRGTGYSLETALADLIDNSITAEAQQIDLSLDWNNGAPLVVIADDGRGMNEDELISAMRFGGAGPFTVRSSSDLGRFGLGLKTASLSQCRRLTVSSRREAGWNTFSWDLDHVRRGGDSWELLEGVPAELKQLFDTHADKTAGTVVVWDRIDFGRVREQPTLSAFLAQIERTERHLAMVFHRFLGGDARKIRVLFNNRRIKGWDPFLETHEATIPRPAQRLNSGGEQILVQGFVLPHPDRFANLDERDAAGGPEGWAAQQGFYVYRQKRLLTAGGWLGVGGTKGWTREEFSRLARIRIDLPNSIDEDWHIDIRKAQAKPPELLRADLGRIAADVRSIARDVFFHRAGRTTNGSAGVISRIWIVDPPPATRRFSIFRDHPLVELIRSALGDGRELLESLCEVIERTVPVDRIWLDAVDNGPQPAKEPDPAEYAELLRTARSIVTTMMAAGLDRHSAIAAVTQMEPFESVPDVAAKLIEP